MERGVERLGQDQGPHTEAKRQDEAHDEEPRAIGCGRDLGGDGRVENPKALALLPLLHALGKLRLFVTLPERVVELLRRLVVAGELQELLFAPGRVLEPGLIRGDRRAEALLLGLQDLDLGLGGAKRLPQPQGVGA